MFHNVHYNFMAMVAFLKRGGGLCSTLTIWPRIEMATVEQLRMHLYVLLINLWPKDRFHRLSQPPSVYVWTIQFINIQAA